MTETIRERIYQAIVDYVNSTQKPVGRQRLAQLTNLKLAVIDEHIKTLKNIEGRVYSGTPGYFEPVAVHPPDRDISITTLTNGMRKIEIGDELLEVTPHEWQVLGSLATGAARELADRQDDRHVLGTLASMSTRLKEQQKMMRDMAARLAALQRLAQTDLFGASA